MEGEADVFQHQTRFCPIISQSKYSFTCCSYVFALLKLILLHPSNDKVSIKSAAIQIDYKNLMFHYAVSWSI